jgi:hypothetical protein
MARINVAIEERVSEKLESAGCRSEKPRRWNSAAPYNAPIIYSNAGP